MITNCRHHSPRVGIRRLSDLPEPNHRLPRPLVPPLRISLTARRPTPSTIHSAPPPPLLTWDPRPRLPVPLSQFSAPSLPFRFRPQIQILHLLLHTPTTRPTATILSLLVRLFHSQFTNMYWLDIFDLFFLQYSLIAILTSARSLKAHVVTTSPLWALIS